MENLKGKVFIYPTDTIYGIGCDANDAKSIKKIRKLKNRPIKPFTIIAPSKKWIYDHFHLSAAVKEAIVEKLPGPFTFILKPKESCPINMENLVPNLDSVGVRIPDHEYTKKFTYPIVTTSVNLSGQPFMTSLEDGDKSILDEVDNIEYVGQINGTPSNIVIGTGKEPMEISRT